MIKYKHALGMAGLAVSLLFAAGAVMADTPVGTGGNRFNFDRDYKSEISAAQAFRLTQGDDREHHKRGDHRDDGQVIIIDVRSIEEYVVGHPNDAYNVPYPNIYGAPYKTAGRAVIKQSALDFFNYVAAKFPDRNTPILTLCRTGKRSVWAANILANPMKWIPARDGAPLPDGVALEGYTNVRNIWEGFEGKYKWDDTLAFALDLNNDGALTPYNEAVMEQNPDRDGWWNYQQLPFSTELGLDNLYGANNGEFIPLYFQQ